MANLEMIYGKLVGIESELKAIRIGMNIKQPEIQQKAIKDLNTIKIQECEQCKKVLPATMFPEKHRKRILCKVCNNRIENKTAGRSARLILSKRDFLDRIGFPIVKPKGYDIWSVNKIATALGHEKSYISRGLAELVRESYMSRERVGRSYHYWWKY